MHEESYHRLNTPDPEINSHLTQSEPTIRRLVKIRYRCHISRHTHHAEHYITVPATDISDFTDKVRVAMSDPRFANDALAGRACLAHDQLGDYYSLTRVSPARTDRIKILGHHITRESDYTCPDCYQVFETIADHRRQIGVGIHDARPLHPEND